MSIYNKKGKNNKIKNLNNNIFDPQILLKTIITDIEILREEEKSTQKSVCNLYNSIRKIVREELAKKRSVGEGF